MKITVEKRLHVNANVITFSYGGVNLFFPLAEETNLLMTGDLQEKNISDLMNLCITALQDAKRAKLTKHDENKDRIRFVGVDYS